MIHVILIRGDEVLGKLRRGFWTELLGRFGNLYYVREEGEQSSVLSSTEAVAGCLRSPEGCAVVPGVPQDQYLFTLWTSIAGGIVAGSAARINPQAGTRAVQGQPTPSPQALSLQWVLLFSPLWATLFVSFGLGPIYSRSDSVEPLLANTAAFLVAAAAPTLLATLLKRPDSRPPEE